MSSIEFCWLAIGQNYFLMFITVHENSLGYIFFPCGKAPSFLQGWLKLLEIFISVESETSWLEPQFELKDFQLSLARDLFSFSSKVKIGRKRATALGCPNSGQAISQYVRRSGMIWCAFKTCPAKIRLVSRYNSFGVREKVKIWWYLFVILWKNSNV